MPNLTGRGALGQKAPKQPAKARKPVPKVSAKRKAYMRSQARVDGVAHMGRVAQLPCLVCGCYGVEVHHMQNPRSDLRVVPLCPQHHRREYGPGAYHYSRRNFNALHGSDDELLARVDDLLKR